MNDSDETEAPFWLVWSDNGPSTVRHYKKSEAKVEAYRLSKKNIDTAFYIAEVQFGYVSHAEITKIHLVEGRI